MLTPAHQARIDILESLGLKLSPEFIKALLLDAKEQIVTGGVRAGKSTLLAAKIWTYPYLFLKPCLIWLVAPTYKAAESEMNYLHAWASKFGMVAGFSTPNNEVWQLILSNGTMIETRSATVPERLASVAPDFIAVTEAGQCSPQVRTALLGRALEKNATIVYGGTLETDDFKPQYAWYEALAVQFAAEDSPDHTACMLPSWANLSIFPGGEHDEKIERMRPENGGYDPYTFARMVGGQPIGAAHPAYPALQTVEADSKFLQVLPEGVRWLTSVGGGDWGVQHPWALVVVSVSSAAITTAEDVTGYKRYIAWVRECVCSTSGDVQEFNGAKRILMAKYGAARWGVDPVQSSLADNAGTETVSGSAGSRDRRIGMVRSRHNSHTLMYDLNGPGVMDLYKEQKNVRYRLTPQGKFELVRLADDRTAALEDGIEVLDAAAAYLPSAPPKKFGWKKLPRRLPSLGRA